MNADVSKICKNYKKIIECEFLDDDAFSHKLVEYYKTFINNTDASNPDSIKKLQNLDDAVYRYVDDYKFSKRLRDTIDIPTVISESFSYLNELIDYIVVFCNEYNDPDGGVVVQTRWI